MNIEKFMCYFQVFASLVYINAEEVQCPTSICYSFIAYEEICETFLGPLCQYPCNDTLCRKHFTYHVQCDEWQCTDIIIPKALSGWAISGIVMAVMFFLMLMVIAVVIVRRRYNVPAFNDDNVAESIVSESTEEGDIADRARQIIEEARANIPTNEEEQNVPNEEEVNSSRAAMDIIRDDFRIQIRRDINQIEHWTHLRGRLNHNYQYLQEDISSSVP